MAKEGTVDITAENPVSPGTVEPTPKEGETAETTPQGKPADNRFVGLDPGKLAQIAYEQDKLIGRLGDKVGRVDALEQQLSYLHDEMRRGRETRDGWDVRETGGAQPSSDFDYSDPKGWVEREIERRIEREREKIATEMTSRRNQEMYAEAMHNLGRGKKAAFSRNHDLYDGIEKEVEGAMMDAVRMNPMNRFFVDDPDQWDSAAIFIRAQRKELDKIVPPKKRGMEASGGETPARVSKPRDEDEEMTLTDDEVSQAEADGMDLKTAKEIKAKEIQMRRRGLNRGTNEWR